MVSTREITDIADGASANRLILRITPLVDGESGGGATRDILVAEGIIGSPEGRAIGSVGDVRYRRDIAQIWQKLTGQRTRTGWVLIADPEAEFFDSDPNEIDLVNDATLTSIYQVTIPANTLGTNRVLEANIKGDALNASGGATGVTLRITFGGVTLYEDSTGNNIALAGDRRAFNLRLCLANRDDAALQIGGGRFTIGFPGAPTTGFGKLGNISGDGGDFGFVQSTVDTTADRVLDVLIANSVADADVSFRKKLAYSKIVG